MLRILHGRQTNLVCFHQIMNAEFYVEIMGRFQQPKHASQLLAALPKNFLT